MKVKKEDFITGICDVYDPELLENRVNIEACIISCIYKDALLIDDSNLTSKDFITCDGRYYYSLASHLRKAGLSVFDEVAVTSHINEEMQPAWEEHGGWDAIANAVEIVDTANFNKYIGDLYKYNAVLALYKDGFNVLTKIKDGTKEYRPIDLFKRDDFTAEMVQDFYEMRIAKIGTGYSSRILEEETIDFDDDFIDSCLDGSGNDGVSFEFAGEDVNGDPVNVFPFLSRQINGFPKVGCSVISGYSGCGKSTLMIGIILSLVTSGRKVVIISNEERVKRFKIKFLVWIIYKYFREYSVTRSKITSGNLTDKDKKLIKNAQQYWKDNFKGYVKFIGIPDSDMSLVKKKIRECVLREGYDTVFYDTMKIDFNDSSSSKEYISVLKDARALDELSKRYGIMMLFSIQLALHTLGKLFLDASCLSQCKAVKETLENLLMMRIVYPDELDPKSKYYCNPFRLINVDGKWTEQEYHADPTATWLMLFTEKTRDGEVSASNGKAYLLRCDFAHSVLKESCMCRPKHGYIQ